MASTRKPSVAAFFACRLALIASTKLAIDTTRLPEDSTRAMMTATSGMVRPGTPHILPSQVVSGVAGYIRRDDQGLGLPFSSIGSGAHGTPSGGRGLVVESTPL